MRRLLTIAAATCLAVLTASAAQAGTVGGLPLSSPVIVPGPAHWFAPHAARPGMGAAHWYGRGRYGWWGKVPRRSHTSRSLLTVDQLQNPGNGEIMPTTPTYLIFWLPSGFHYNDSAGRRRVREPRCEVLPGRRRVADPQHDDPVPGNNGTPADTSELRGLDRRHDRVSRTRAPTSPTRSRRATSPGDLPRDQRAGLAARRLSDMYFMFLPDNVVDCDNTRDQLQHEQVLRIPHARLERVGHDGKRVHLGRHPGQPQRLLGRPAAGTRTSPATTPADTTLSSMEHEHMEAITDPLLNAWLD